MVQKIIAFIAPKIIGGIKAPSAVGDLGFQLMRPSFTVRKCHG
jgi:diaminohydroxyphosphoribosylaminopyrimidine deaminase/5-amino-6-(5-phosphoribosylamino)uracil reductase